MTAFDSSNLRTGAQTFGVTLDSSQVQAFEKYFRMLQEWNEKLNLTRVPSEETIAVHFLDSLSIAQAHTPVGKVLDVGTGAGFPGIPLKIAFPSIQLTVMDSIAKKLSFIEALCRELGITVEILCARAEVAAHDPSRRESFDLVTSRAVADLAQLSHWMLPFVKVGGSAIAMKSQDSAAELDGARADITQLGSSPPQVMEVRVPGIPVSRKLIVMKKETPTPAALPKRGNVKKRK